MPPGWNTVPKQGCRTLHFPRLSPVLSPQSSIHLNVHQWHFLMSLTHSAPVGRHEIFIILHTCFPSFLQYDFVKGKPYRFLRRLLDLEGISLLFKGDLPLCFFRIISYRQHTFPPPCPADDRLKPYRWFHCALPLPLLLSSLSFPSAVDFPRIGPRASPHIGTTDHSVHYERKRQISLIFSRENHFGSNGEQIR